MYISTSLHAPRSVRSLFIRSYGNDVLALHWFDERSSKEGSLTSISFVSLRFCCRSAIRSFYFVNVSGQTSPSEYEIASRYIASAFMNKKSYFTFRVRLFARPFRCYAATTMTCTGATIPLHTHTHTYARSI